MTLEEIDFYIHEANRFIPMGSVIGRISVIPWPAKPFDPIEHYVDFKIFGNLFASEKLSELTIDRFFECCDSMMNKKDGYEEWKRQELRNSKISQII